MLGPAAGAMKTPLVARVAFDDELADDRRPSEFPLMVRFMGRPELSVLVSVANISSRVDREGVLAICFSLSFADSSASILRKSVKILGI